MKTIQAADLFCGAGGTSTGILQAGRDLNVAVNLLAINHWSVAINSHTLNHPSVRHRCANLDDIRPVDAVPGGRLHLMAASPECTHHSLAAGGRPKNDQSRATAWHVCRWVADLAVENIFIENVREFQDWGPIDARGKPIKSRKGETFRAFIQSLESMNYRVEYRVQNAAEFGDPTSRKRLIIMARRGGGPITWPTPTHGPGLKPFRTAREIIDWELKGKSIFNRKKKLSPNTIRRIAAGLRKFGGANAEPFLVMLYGTNDARSVDRPAPTVSANGNHIGLAEPFVSKQNAALVEPFLLPPEGIHRGNAPRSLDQPLNTVTAGRGGGALVEPFLIHSTPVPTVTGAHRGELGLVEPMLIGQLSCAAARPVSQTCPTIAGAGAIALVEPFIVKYYGTRTAVSLADPLDTVTSKDRFMLVEPKTGRVVAELDILFRMLQPEELSAAMSFPTNYKFYGTKEQRVKQIGNAVPVELARAHAAALLK